MELPALARVLVAWGLRLIPAASVPRRVRSKTYHMYILRQIVYKGDFSLHLQLLHPGVGRERGGRVCGDGGRAEPDGALLHRHRRRRILPLLRRQNRKGND